MHPALFLKTGCDTAPSPLLRALLAGGPVTRHRAWAFFSARSTLPRGPHTSGARPVDLLGPSASQLLREPRDDQTNSAMEGRGVITEVPQPPAATPSPCSPINSRVLWIHCLCRREKRERERARELGEQAQVLQHAWACGVLRAVDIVLCVTVLGTGASPSLLANATARCWTPEPATLRIDLR